MTTPLFNTSNPTPAQIIARCEGVLAHVWMVRTFIKHSEEAEEFPELYAVARTLFDVARAVETRLDDPAKYLHMLRKKLSRLNRAAAQFAEMTPEISTHTNFSQAVISLNAAVAELKTLADLGTAALAKAPTAPPANTEPKTTSEADDNQDDSPHRQ